MFLWRNNNKYSIDNKVVIVTGALGGIGKGLVQRLAQKGARVMLVDMQHIDIGVKSVQETNDIYGDRVTAYVQVDLSTKEGISQMFSQTILEFGRIDILINNAGLASPYKLFEGGETFENIRAMLAVNLQAPIEATRLFVEYVQRRSQQDPTTRAVVVNVASMAGLAPTVGAEIYGAAKAGLLHLTKSCAPLAPLVRVSAVAPYFVRTPMVLDNPKHKNNKTILPALMLSVDQVCDAVERCIEDLGSAGKIHAIMGCVTFRRIWIFELSWIQVAVLGMWALLLAPLRRFFK
ncbi:hypothetical protein IW140_005858 [Coemansia sp. RSA 1813]|nr:hypothetical protein EV178_002598 [Coemansia sp. RSA 1646]KAJ1767964.1 hypothetical protein LPJ74_005101 [Coemansia sp. RSA 1843]KAJ2086351.1 hypothetical protein IW138_005771 [Coemansia sp. RSA 986]KAJ2211002.1 hypothetical protein EV179_005843 [Coemansia sp. RSA 487]KAJ2564155.1 hypothetical protein IW140_005858 [Coemansia sp. RSA 1813]